MSSAVPRQARFQQFKRIIWKYYREHRRAMPWRPPSLAKASYSGQSPQRKSRRRAALKLQRDKNTLDPYKIFVSEVMLQQTQAPRVVPKYESFVKRFPTFSALADAPLSDVLKEWKGLGYSRRAVNLRRAADIVAHKYKGKLPARYDDLVALPGIGPNTAGSLLAFAFNKPVVFIETNIRSVFLHFFFKNKNDVSDKDLVRYIELTVDRINPREWYYALMDYGALLKKTANPNIRSRHYARQSPFKGSRREYRSKVLSLILESGSATARSAARKIGKETGFAQEILDELVREGFITKRKTAYLPA